MSTLKQAGAIISVFLTWTLTAAWLQRLREGRRVGEGWRRKCMIVGTVLLGPWLLAGVIFGVRGGWEGPLHAETAVLLPLLWITLAVTELGLKWRSRALRVLLGVVPVGMGGLFYLADQRYEIDYAYHVENQSKQGTKSAHVFEIPYDPDPRVLDGYMLTGPAPLLTSLVQSLIPEGIRLPRGWARLINAVLVASYWSLWVAVLRGMIGFRSTLARACRKAALCVSAFVVVMGLIAWHVGGQHGPNGALGLWIGSLLVFLCLWQARTLQHPVIAEVGPG